MTKPIIKGIWTTQDMIKYFAQKEDDMTPREVKEWKPMKVEIPKHQKSGNRAGLWNLMRSLTNI